MDMEKEAIKEAVKEAFKEELRAFYIDRETHYKHHEFIQGWIDWMSQCKSTIMRTIVGAAVIAVLGLMTAGFIFKYGGK